MGLFFTYLMTYGGAVVGLFRPYIGFLVYVCFSIVRPESLWHWSVPQGNYSRIIAVSFLIGWILAGFGNRRLGAATWPIISLTCFWCWSALSTMNSAQPDVGWAFLDNMSKIVIPCIAGITMINSRRDITLLAWTIVGSLGYVAYDLNMSYFSGFNRLQEVGFGGMDNNSLTIGLVAGVGFAFFLGLSETSFLRRYLAFAAAAFMTHAVLFSFSRGGMLGLGIVGVASAVLVPKSPKNVTLMIFGACIALAMAGPQVWERFSSITQNSLTGAELTETEASAESRVKLWGICLRMTAENPILGKGPDHYPLLVQEYPVTGYIKEFFPKGKEAHSLWLQIMAEIGIPGVLFLAGYYVFTAVKLRPFVRLDNRDSLGLTEGATARMVLASLVGFIVSAQFVSLEGLELPYYIALVGLAMLKQSAPRVHFSSLTQVGDGDLFAAATSASRPLNAG